ncbi:MAG: bifunctional phosphoribosyl-AMP cyclohydrolase/phosphoribosyl-ATP diphosphatase HisIE, partial [Clostridia bacterium]|nr:bifunctional phosphoribosyl-AMP cyclohydrolase/phosphoribosyl-ATP diphosphatase HisIE [Clostridia bacterium]
MAANTIDVKKIKFNKEGLVPVVVQDYESGEVLMLVYMNEEAVNKTVETGYAHYYSRSKKAVTKFGEVLGNTQKVKAAFIDHDSDTLLLKVAQKGKADPEKNTFTCFPEQLIGEYNNIGGEMFGRLQRIIAEYRANPEEGAYTSFLFVRGVDRIGKKVGEEAVELVIAAKNEEKVGVINEAADLLYHMMVLLNVKDVKISEVCAELCKR